MKTNIVAALASVTLVVTACKDNPAAPSRDRVVAGSQQTLQALITGAVAQERANAGGGAYQLYAGIMARDAIVPTVNESRFVTEFYNTPPDPSDFIGGSLWTGFYVAIRAEQNVLTDASFTKLGAGDQAATRGFLRTLMGLEYIQLLEYRDQNGIVIQGNDAAKADPIRTKQSALAATSALLDSALTDLNAAASAGTTSLPFALPSGYSLHSDYSQVSNLILLNRGLKGKAEVFRALDPVAPNATSAAAAIVALNAALVGAPSNPDQEYLNRGPWFEYNPSSPESAPNPLPSVTSLVTYNFVSSVSPGDLRARKILPAGRLSVQGDSAANRLAITDPNNAANLSAPLPIIRNAELYLLRAQAEIAAGDLASAGRDINVVHTVEGGLPEYGNFTSGASAIGALLYEYRYSFAYMGPQHLNALREYQMLNAAYVSQPGMPGPGPGKDALVQSLPITQNEINARNGNIAPVP